MRFLHQHSIALLALFVALGGTSIAASHYIITSQFQIAPGARHALRGHTGETGPTGPQIEPKLIPLRGVTGPQGPPGRIVIEQQTLNHSVPGPQGVTGPTGRDGGVDQWEVENTVERVALQMKKEGKI